MYRAHLIRSFRTIFIGLAERALELASDLGGVFDGPLPIVGGHLLEYTGLTGRFLTAEHEDWLPLLLVVPEFADWA